MDFLPLSDAPTKKPTPKPKTDVKSNGKQNSAVTTTTKESKSTPVEPKDSQDSPSLFQKLIFGNKAKPKKETPKKEILDDQEDPDNQYTPPPFVPAKKS